MLECEVKLLDIDKEHVVRRLQKLGAQATYEELIVDIYLRRDIVQKEKARARVRCTHDKTVLTIKYKLPAEGVKLAYEVDTILPDTLVENTITHHRGDIVDHVRVKKRASYAWGGYTFDIDQYRGLPVLLEIEGPTAKQVDSLVKDLGFADYTRFPKGAKSLYAHYDVALPMVSASFLTRLLAVIRSW